MLCFVVLNSEKHELCLFCVNEGVVSTAECGPAHEAKGEEYPTQTITRVCRKSKEDRG